MGSAFSSYELSNNLFKTIERTHELELSTMECRLIEKSWDLARKQGMDEPGRSILLELLKKDSSIEKKFGSCTSRRQLYSEKLRRRRRMVKRQSIFGAAGPGSSIRRSESVKSASSVKVDANSEGRPEFYLHTQSFTATLDMIVKAIPETSKLDVILRDLGRRHAKLDTERGFIAKYWDTFAEAVIDRSLNWGTGYRNHRNTLLRIAWIKLTLYMIETIKAGYFDCLKIERRFQSEVREKVYQEEKRRSFKSRCTRKLSTNLTQLADIPLLIAKMRRKSASAHALKASVPQISEEVLSDHSSDKRVIEENTGEKPMNTPSLALEPGTKECFRRISGAEPSLDVCTNSDSVATKPRENSNIRKSATADGFDRRQVNDLGLMYGDLYDELHDNISWENFSINTVQCTQSKFQQLPVVQQDLNQRRLPNSHSYAWETYHPRYFNQFGQNRLYDGTSTSEVENVVQRPNSSRSSNNIVRSNAINFPHSFSQNDHHFLWTDKFYNPSNVDRNEYANPQSDMKIGRSHSCNFGNAYQTRGYETHKLPRIESVSSSSSSVEDFRNGIKYHGNGMDIQAQTNLNLLNNNNNMAMQDSSVIDGEIPTGSECISMSKPAYDMEKFTEKPCSSDRGQFRDGHSVINESPETMEKQTHRSPSPKWYSANQHSSRSSDFEKNANYDKPALLKNLYPSESLHYLPETSKIAEGYGVERPLTNLASGQPPVGSLRRSNVSTCSKHKSFKDDIEFGSKMAANLLDYSLESTSEHLGVNSDLINEIRVCLARIRSLIFRLNLSLDYRQHAEVTIGSQFALVGKLDPEEQVCATKSKDKSNLPTYQNPSNKMTDLESHNSLKRTVSLSDISSCAINRSQCTHWKPFVIEIKRSNSI